MSGPKPKQFTLLIKPGSQVRLGPDLTGIVTEAKIAGRELNQSYLVIWWDGSTRHEKWMEAFEITSDLDSYSLKIGFVQ